MNKPFKKLSKEAEPNIKVLDIDENSNNKKLITQIIRLTLGLILSGLGMYFENNLVILLAYLTLLSNCIINSIKLLIKSHTINENLLITISCFGAYILGEIHEGLMVVILYEIGKILETLAVDNSRKSISKLMDIKPEYANLKTTEGVEQVTPEEVKINDVIIVKKGEKIFTIHSNSQNYQLLPIFTSSTGFSLSSLCTKTSPQIYAIFLCIFY